ETDDGGGGVVATDGDGDGEDDAPNQSLAGETVERGEVAGAECLRDEDGGADLEGGQDRNDEEDEFGGGADAGDRGLVETGYHQGVDGADGGLEEVLADDGQGKGEDASARHRWEPRNLGGRVRRDCRVDATVAREREIAPGGGRRFDYFRCDRHLWPSFAP